MRGSAGATASERTARPAGSPVPAEVQHQVGLGRAPRAPASSAAGQERAGSLPSPRQWAGRDGGEAWTPPFTQLPPSEGTGPCRGDCGAGDLGSLQTLPFHRASSHGASRQVPVGQAVDANAWKSFRQQSEPGASAAQKTPQLRVPLVQGGRPQRSRAASGITSRACSRAANLRGGWGTAGSRTCLSQPNLILLR